MSVARFRFYEELNAFLAPQRRKQNFELRCAEAATLKNAIESVGVPHTEVELILVNGESRDFTYRVQDGDLVSVYPMFEAFDITPLLRVRPAPLRDPRFIADAQLGALARRLRMLGFDTLFDNPASDAEIRRRAIAERRTILTRDRQLLICRDVTHGCYVHALQPIEQLREIVARLQLGAQARPFTLCLCCNARLEAVAKESVLERLPPAVAQHHTQFKRCPSCERVYWPGDHYRRMNEALQPLLSHEHNGAMNSPDWLTRLEARAQRAPALAREPLCIAGVECGSIEPALAQRMRDAGLPLRRDVAGWALDGADAALAALAAWMHAHGLGGRWRDELMPVLDADGVVRGAVERAAVRPLGITTQAVHLVGVTAAGSVWVQQRAFDKATDPGQWDTLMGGLMGAGESVAQTLARETWEEAGLHVDQLAEVEPIGSLTVRRPLPDGYMIEHIHMFEARVPDGLVPQNQDGEVERFECLSVATLIERLQAGEFTLEAALIHARWLQRRSLL